MLKRLARPSQSRAVVAKAGCHFTHAIFAIGDEYEIIRKDARVNLAVAPIFRHHEIPGMILCQGNLRNCPAKGVRVTSCLNLLKTTQRQIDGLLAFPNQGIKVTGCT
jgi:hypothetical protein